jgi:hypothetical protein
MKKNKILLFSAPLIAVLMLFALTACQGGSFLIREEWKQPADWECPAAVFPVLTQSSHNSAYFSPRLDKVI